MEKLRGDAAGVENDRAPEMPANRIASAAARGGGG